MFFCIRILFGSWTATYTVTLPCRNVLCMFPVHVNQSTLLLRQIAAHITLLNLIGFKKIASRISFHFRHTHKIMTIQSVQRLGRGLHNQAIVVTFWTVKGLSLLKASRPAIEPTTEWVPHSLGVNRPGVELTTHIHPLPRLWISVPLHFPTLLHEVQKNNCFLQANWNFAYRIQVR